MSMELSDVPGRAFLDTVCVNFILDHGECIFDGVPPHCGMDLRSMEDIEALRGIFATGRRANWQLAVSPFTYKEIMSTNDPLRRHYIETWFMEIWHYWLAIIQQSSDLPSFADAEHERIRILSSGVLDVLPDIEDRMLLSDAIVYRCDVFCTRDWNTILKHRKHIESLPVQVLRPKEWWESIKPFAALWT